MIDLSEALKRLSNIQNSILGVLRDLPSISAGAASWERRQGR